MHLGKNGITKNFMETMKNHFKNHESVKVSVLKSAGHDKEQVKKYIEEILGELGRRYTGKTIGFTIALRKWKRDVR